MTHCDGIYCEISCKHFIKYVFEYYSCVVVYKAGLRFAYCQLYGETKLLLYSTGGTTDNGEFKQYGATESGLSMCATVNGFSSACKVQRPVEVALSFAPFSATEYGCLYSFRLLSHPYLLLVPGCWPLHRSG